MATVPMPEVTYRPDLPESVLNGGLSAVQLEAVAIAGQQNDIVLPGGFRGSALVGDGTGVGKGRISAGILLDNYRRGRKRLVWVSEKWDLMQDAMRDLSGIGATPLLRGITQQEGKFVLGANAAVTPFKKYNASAKIDHDGVLFSTYALIRSEDKNGNRRVAQLEQYLRGDDGGEGAYIVFDEAHNLKNAVASQGGQVSQIGRAVKELLERIPNLRTVSLSATAATDVVNLGYLDRLGLWGAGTPFPNGFGEFQTQVAPGGVAAMELIARELKAQGKYLSRTLSFKGVEYSEAEHKLNDDQKALYRTAANAWASVLQSAEATIANTTNGGGRQKGRFLAQFYGAQLRFFGVLISSLKIPTAVDLANKALADGKSVVITLVNTNEAAQNREKTKATNENEQDEPPDYDFGPKEMLKELVKNNYPVQQFRDDVDSSGAPIKVPVYRTDADGREVPVNNPEAEAARDALVKKIDRELHMPENPLDSLIQALGGDKKVAELTGRKEKYDRTLEKFVPRGDPSAKRDEVNIFEMRAFQSGKKRVAILSSAAGTGISLHAGKDVRNQQKRYHMTLQVGWSADKAMQMFGRTHRTNQVHAPQYVMLVSDLGGERRFVSTIARRLGSLGALTKGQKNATTGTDLMEKVNFETDQGKKATRSFYQGLEQNQPIPGTGLTGHQILADLHVQKTTRDGGMDIPQADRTNVTKLLNRLLALDPDIQQGAYNYFYDIFEAAVKSAIEEGTLDTGVRTLPGDEFSLGKTETLAKDKSTGAETFYYPVAAKVRTERMKPADMAYRLKTDGELHIGKGDRLVLSVPANAIVHDDGKVELAVYVATASHGNWRRVAATTLRNSPTVDKWAEEQLDKAKEEQRSKKQNIKYYEDEVKRAESAGRTLSDDQFPKSALIARRAELELAEANLVTAKRIADDPEEWATGLWEEQYKAAPSHEVEEHHLIGGAVMRFWNPIKDATFVRDSIYTAADSKTGQRIVGVDIPAEHIGQLLQRIKGGASTVSTDQLYADVLRNNLTYTLEGGTQVRRGRVGREFVVQLIPGTADIAANLKRLGVLYEKGITPIYYLPEKKAQAILGAVTKAYPIQPDQDQQPEGPLRAALGKPRSSSGVAPSHQILPRAIYRKGVLWTNSETMNMLADLAGGGRSTSYHGFYLPAMGAQKLLNKLNALPSASPIRQAIFDVLAGPLKKAVREAISRNGGLIVVTYDKGDPLDNLKTTLRHEKFHEVTKEMGGYARGGILLTHPLAQKAAANLGKKGYESKDAAEMFSEIGAHLASGPVGWKEMGLDRAQAKVLFRRYLELLDKSTIAKMRSIAPQLREVIYGYNAQADLRADPDSASRDFEELAGERDIRRGVREDVPAGEGRIQGNRKSEREEDKLSPVERLKRLPGEESGQINFTTLGDRLTQVFGDDGPKVNYSGMGATKRLFLPGRNLAEVEEASRPVFEAALPAASADALASTTLQSVTPAIMRTLSGSGFTFPELRLYYVESRLRGVRDRWERFSQEADDMSPEQMESNMEALPDGSPSPYLDLLDKVEGRHGMAQNLSQTAVALAQQEDWDTLKTFLAIAFEDAADRVATVMPADQFDAIHDAVRTNPKVREADRLYGEIEKVMADAHAVNEGIFSTDLGPAGRYYPLIPTNIEQKSGPGRRLAYHKPRNTANAFATGLSEDYDTGMEAFSKKLSSGVRSNYKANLIENMRQQGWLIPESQASRNAEGKLVMTGPDDVEYVAAREETKQARTILKDGKVIHLPARFGVMPAFMNAGLRATLDREPLDPNAVINAMRWANMLATKGPLELAYHSAGVLGALYANTPFLGGSGLDKALSLPLMKWFSIRGKLLNIDPTQPENIEKLREMAKAGALPAKSGKITYSKEYAEMTGAERERFSFGPMLYGPKGIDARARILMYDIFKAAYPNGTTSEMHHFVNQIGNYTPELQGVIERGLKQIGLGPFATAGMTRIVNAVQTFTGGGPGKGGTLESKIWWWLTSSAIIGLAAWIIAHKALTGKWPTQRKQSALMDIAVVPGGGGYIDKARYSKWGKAMWGSGPEVGHLKFSFFDNPLVLRGAHAMGLAGAYQTKQLGGSPGQIMEAAELDITNSLAHPAMGPAARAAFVLKTGEKPYLTGMHDRGRVALRMFPAIPPKTKPGLPSVGARAWAGMKELNSFYTDAAENLAGMTGFADPNEHSKGSFWMKLPFTIFAPGLVGEANSPYKKAEMLRQERAAH